MRLCSSSGCLDPWMELAHMIFFFSKSQQGSMCNAGHPGRNADDLRTKSAPLSFLYKPLQWLVHFSSFQFSSQHLINLILFVHWEMGTHCKFWMQTIQEGKVWIQLCLPHKPFIFWWILLPGIDLCISCRNKTQVTKDHPTNKPNYWYLPPDTVSRVLTSAFFHPSFSGVQPNLPTNRTRFNWTRVEQSFANISYNPFNKQSLISKLKCFKSPFLVANTGTGLRACEVQSVCGVWNYTKSPFHINNLKHSALSIVALNVFSSWSNSRQTCWQKNNFISIWLITASNSTSMKWPRSAHQHFCIQVEQMLQRSM